MRERIGASLAAIEAEHDVRILFAVESGSRAWGFPSPDSDYDVRFVHVHALDWYLSLTPRRDVIELPITDELDVAGWDLRKALNLLIKPNPVLLEWLSSPIRYRWSEAAEDVARLARRTAPARACLHHYAKLAEGQRRAHLEGETVVYKQYFYALLPALAIRWVRLRPDVAPPMNLDALCSEADLDGMVLAEIARLVRIKAEAPEDASGPRLPRLDALIEAEIDFANSAPATPENPDLRQAAEDLFRAIAKRERARIAASTRQVARGGG